MKLPCPKIGNSCLRRKGFTLVEILVVVTIIGVLVSIGIASYHDFNEKRMIKRAAEELKLYIRLAGSKAINNEKNCNQCGGSDNDCATFTEGEDLALSGWFVDLTSREIYGMCGSTSECDSDGTRFGDKSFDKDISITGDPDQSFCFYPLVGGTDLLDTLTISVDPGGEDIELIVDPSGNVSD